MNCHVPEVLNCIECNPQLLPLRYESESSHSQYKDTISTVLWPSSTAPYRCSDILASSSSWQHGFSIRRDAFTLFIDGDNYPLTLWKLCSVQKLFRNKSEIPSSFLELSPEVPPFYVFLFLFYLM